MPVGRTMGRTRFPAPAGAAGFAGARVRNPDPHIGKAPGGAGLPAPGSGIRTLTSAKPPPGDFAGAVDGVLSLGCLAGGGGVGGDACPPGARPAGRRAAPGPPGCRAMVRAPGGEAGASEAGEGAWRRRPAWPAALARPARRLSAGGLHGWAWPGRRAGRPGARVLPVRPAGRPGARVRPPPRLGGRVWPAAGRREGRPWADRRPPPVVAVGQPVAGAPWPAVSLQAEAPPPAPPLAARAASPPAAPVQQVPPPAAPVQ